MTLHHPLTTRLLLLVLAAVTGYGGQWAWRIALTALREGTWSSKPKDFFDWCCIILFMGIMPFVAFVSCAALIRSLV
jgi:hypothetical protein